MPPYAAQVQAPAPAELDDATIAASVADGWGIEPGDVHYLAVGGGGYHWRLTGNGGESWFVTVDDLDSKDWLGDDRAAVAHGLNASLATAWWLRDTARLPFVMAPLPTLDGLPLVRLGDRFAVSVLPYVEGRSNQFGPYSDSALRRRVLDMLIEMHGVTPRVGIPDHTRPRVGPRCHLDAYLREPGEIWDTGPFGEPARELLAPRAEELAARLESFDDVCASLSTHHTIVTHGEPHAGNVMTVGAGEVLIDWDTVGVAAPERDLWFVVEDAADIEHYAAATGHRPNATALAVYRTRWQFDDLASIIKLLRSPHSDEDGSARWLDALGPLIEEIVEAPGRRD